MLELTTTILESIASIVTAILIDIARDKRKARISEREKIKKAKHSKKN